MAATSSPHTPGVFHFGGNELDTSEFELRRDGVRVPIARLPLELLIILVERRGNLVSREELASVLWNGKCDLVDTRAGLNNAINRVRAALNDNAEQPRFVETVIGKGYRFIAPLEREPEKQPNLAPRAAIPFPVNAGPAQVEPMRPAGNSRVRFGLAMLASLIAIAVGGLAFRPIHLPDLPKVLGGWQVTFNDGANPISTAAIAPNGASIAYFDTLGLFEHSLGNGQNRQLEFPLRLRADHLSWSGDGKTLLISAYDTEKKESQIWSLRPAGHERRKLLTQARNASFSPDGQHIVSITAKGAKIVISSADGTQAKPLAAASPHSLFTAVTWSVDGQRILYIQQPAGLEVRPTSAEDAGAHAADQYLAKTISDGRVVAKEVSFQFDRLYPTPDGKLLLLWLEHLGGKEPAGLWTSHLDGKTSVLLDRPALSLDNGDRLLTSVSTTADGTFVSGILESGQADVYIASCCQSSPIFVPQPLTHDVHSDFPDAWTPDGNGVIFESNRSGSYHLYRQNLDGKTPVPLTTMPGDQVSATISVDGKWILFAQINNANSLDHKQSRLFRIPLEGGNPSEVSLHEPLDEFRCPLRGETCVIRETLDHRFYDFFALDPVRGRGRLLAEVPWMQNVYGDWTLAFDGSAVALPIHDKGAPGILVVPLGTPAPLTKVKVKSEGQLWGIHSAAGAQAAPRESGVRELVEGVQAWYGEIISGTKHSLVLIDSAGNVDSTLRTSDYPIWAYPSPDGSKVAFVDYSRDRNVWIWPRKLSK